MPKFLQDSLMILWAVANQVISNEKPGFGSEKKAAVIAAVNKILEEPGGLDWPSWFPANLRLWALGLSVDAVVALLNRTGFLS